MTSLLAVALVACSSDDGASQGSGDGSAGGETVSVTDGSVTITAADLVFDASTIEAPAGESFTVTLVNNDSVPHNFSVYTEEGGEAIVQGDTINGGETVDVEVPAQDAGDYFFKCDIHPDMNGTLVVG